MTEDLSDRRFSAIMQTIAKIYGMGLAVFCGFLQEVTMKAKHKKMESVHQWIDSRRENKIKSSHYPQTAANPEAVRKSLQFSDVIVISSIHW